MKPDVLFLALTRPALVWGVPLEALMLNVFVCFAAGVELQAPTWWRSPFMFWLMGIPIHFALRVLTGWDYHWARGLRLQLGLMATTYESEPREAPRSAADVPSCV